MFITVLRRAERSGASMIQIRYEQEVCPIIENAVRILRDSPYSLTVELCRGTAASARVRELGLSLDEKSESFVMMQVSENVVLLAGSDSVGVLYGAYALLEALEAADGKADRIATISQSPFTKIRGLYTFLHNEDCERDWFYDKEYWLWWFDDMARNRYNSFNLVFAHQTYYLAPMFAYFLDMPEFPEVFPTGFTREEQRKNHEILAFISELAAARGISFILGIWEVVPWKGDENGGYHPTQKDLVPGLTRENMKDYTYTAMKKLIADFPHVSGIQIRANEESGIPRKMQVDFFTDSLFKAMAEAERPFILDFRCWCAEEETVQNALDMIPATRLSVKYWGEFMGGPYQPAKMSPGYSYSDYLRLPLERDFIYQVWSLGSPRLLLWGDPDYVKRFVYSLTLGEANGFEINPHLAQKGYGNEPGAWRIFKNKDKEYFKWEAERYWLFQLLFGRLSYDPEAGEELWMLPMRRRFGAKAEQVMAAVKAGSALLPYLVQASLSDLNMYVWPEIDLGGLLDYYMATPSTDSCTIDTVPHYVDRWLAGEKSGLFSPWESSREFAVISERIFAALHGLEDDGNRELFSTILDMKVCGFLAAYHSHKILAALHLCLYYRTRDRAALRTSLSEVRRCTVCWEQLIALTQDHYYEEMLTGPTDKGSWKSKLLLLYEDELRVAELLRLSEKLGNFYKGFDFGGEIETNFWWGEFAVNGDYSLERGFELVTSKTEYSLDDGFGWIAGQGQIQTEVMSSVRLTDNHLDPWRRDAYTYSPVHLKKGWRNSLTEDGVYGSAPAQFRVDLPDGNYAVSVLIVDETANARRRGPMSIGVGEAEVFSGLTVLPMEEKCLMARVEICGEPLILSFAGDWFVSGLLIYKVEPHIASVPHPVVNRIHSMVRMDTPITATVTAPDGIAKVELIWNGAAYPMRYVRPDEYEADLCSLPFSEAVMLDSASKTTASQGSYSIRAESGSGFVSETETLSWKCLSKPNDIELCHEPVTTAPLHSDIRIRARIVTAYPPSEVKLCYSAVNQYIPMTKVEMCKESVVGDACDAVWEAVIPADTFEAQWDILYFFEVTNDFGGVVRPDFREQTPYYVIAMER